MLLPPMNGQGEFKNRRKSHSRRGNEAQVFFAPKSASLSRRLPFLNTPRMHGLPEIIRREMAACGSITFARFMELSLYCPQFGYYEQIANTPGRRGDFYTSVSVGPLFGQLLAAQFAQWLGQWETRSVKRGMNEPAPDRLQLLEAGAHSGRLAADILDWFKSRQPQLFDKLEYWILEPSPRRQRWQKKTLDLFNGQVFWFDSWETLPPSGVRGIIFSNELLDAMPVHRLGWDAQNKTWFEWGVSAEGGRFVWQKLPLTKERGHPAAVPDARAPNWPELAAELMAVLPDGFTTEICPAAADWWREAAAALKCGWLLTLDYGLTAAQFICPERAQGTLRAYSRHQQSADLLASPGEQDLTAHVNLTALQKAGESAGLQTEGVFAQGEFLTRIARTTWRDKSGLAEWTPARKRQFQTLTHPEHLGRQFKLLIQTR
jgi:SAM-dependent MidA family methyltransferase